MPIRNMFEQLFGKKDDVSSRDLKVALRGLKRTGRRKQMELRKLSSKRIDLIDRIKVARRNGSSIEVDVLWEELRQVRIDSAYAKREAKVVSLETIGITRYLRGLERLERNNDQTRIRGLLERIRTSGLEKKLYGQEVDESAYLDELGAIMDDVGLEIETWEGEEEDPEKARFLEEIDAINTAEDSGEIEEAIAREENLSKKLEEDKIAEEEEI